MNTLEKISHETMVFMRGNYRLDEIGNGKNELKFKQGKRTFLTVYIHEEKFVFLIIFGKKEREIFEEHRNEFSHYIQEYYDNAKTYHDGKWMFFDVNTMDQLDEMKKLIQIKKKPNRKMFSKDNAVYAQCGHRCDLCGAKQCAFKKGITECIACEDYPCEQATVGDYRSKIHTEVHYADEITWGILPYVPWQYEKTK